MTADPIRHRGDPAIDAARKELLEAKDAAEHIRQLVDEGRCNADAIHTADLRVSYAGRNLAELLAKAAPRPGGTAA